MSQKCLQLAPYAHFIWPSSQAGGPVVTPSGDIEMQTFSVTKKVYILDFLYSFIHCHPFDHQNHV